MKRGFSCRRNHLKRQILLLVSPHRWNQSLHFRMTKKKKEHAIQAQVGADKNVKKKKVHRKREILTKG